MTESLKGHLPAIEITNESEITRFQQAGICLIMAVEGRTDDIWLDIGSLNLKLEKNYHNHSTIVVCDRDGSPMAVIEGVTEERLRQVERDSVKSPFVSKTELISKLPELNALDRKNGWIKLQ